MGIHKLTFNEVLESIEDMPLEEQSMIIEILENRYREKRREEILKNARKTLKEYKKGLTSQGTAADLIKDLESD
jgi:hypothetical protein